MPQSTRNNVAGFWVLGESAPDRLAIVDVDGSTHSYGEVLSGVNKVSHALIDAGVAHGGHALVVSWNRREMLQVALAVGQIGATYTLVNAHSTPAEIAYIISDSRPGVIFVEPGTRELVGEACELAADVNPLVISFGDENEPVSFGTWTGNFPDSPPEERAPGSAMLYTSGTSGRPKGVLKEQTASTPEEAALNATRLLTRLGIELDELTTGEGVHLVTSPLYHSAPIHNALLALHLGHQVVVMDRFDAQRSLELIERHKVTWTHVVPTMMQRWLSVDRSIRETIDVSSMKWLVHAAAPCSVDLKRAMLDWFGPVVYEYYSSTEAGGTAIGPHDWIAHPGSVGRAWPGAEVRILGADRRPLPAGEVGDIFIRNNTPFRYHNDPDKTAQGQVGDYVTVGDVGWLDAEGYLYMADRRDDLILVGGVNVYPAEIEAALMRHPSVTDVAVIGKPHPDLGQVVHAVIQPVAGIDPDDALAESIRAHAESTLGSQKRPKSYAFTTAMPRTDTGKLLRRVLRNELSGE